MVATFCAIEITADRVIAQEERFLVTLLTNADRRLTVRGLMKVAVCAHNFSMKRDQRCLGRGRSQDVGRRGEMTLPLAFPSWPLRDDDDQYQNARGDSEARHQIPKPSGRKRGTAFADKHER